MKCPACGGDCILPARDVLDEIFSIYMACSSCNPDPSFDKKAPFPDRIGRDTGRCDNCGKRHIDYVMGNVLTILKESGFYPGDAALKDVGTPLVVYGFRVPYPPRLGGKSLILIMDAITKDMADKIITQVPEIKGIIKRKGSQSQSIGILDTDAKPHTYELLSGCDIRCDIVSSTFGELCIYKNQSRIHIEFNNTKIDKIEGLFLRGELVKANIVDGFCGPGTLGLLCALGGAKKVILNDAWLPAVENTILNIHVNSGILGAEIDYQKQDYDKNKLIGDKPVLMATAKGKTELMVFHGDIRELEEVVGNCDICLIDTFPLVNPSEYITFCKDIAKKVVVI